MLSIGPEEVSFGSPHAHGPTCHIDPHVADLYSKIHCTLTQGVDEEGDPIPVSTLHLGDQYDDPYIRVEVGLKGPLLHHLCGYLCARVHLECVGSGPEEDFISELKRIDGGAEADYKKCCDKDDDEWCYYKFDVRIDRSVFDDYDEECGEFCCFATTVTSKDRCKRPGHIACWCKGPCVMIHTAPHEDEDEDGEG